ncbi:MAG: S1 RNA-binding domain-containing protein [Anaerolineae bacterium]|nr:S1 RNA-binding domain-containing protein [Anaerolineae bacterium]
MESNIPNLGDDMQPEEIMSDTGHTSVPPQDVIEETANITTPPVEALENTPAEDVEVVEAIADAEITAADAIPAASSDPVAAADDIMDDTMDDIMDDMMDDAADEPEEDELEEEDESEEPGEDAPRVRKGQLVEGRVYETSPTEVLIALDEDLIGVVASRELERMDRTALEALQAGEPVTAYVLKARGSDGRPVLSLARAEEENNWRLAQEHFESQDVYFSTVAGYNKGGLIVRFGKVRGFVPASQVSRERQQRASGGSPEERWGSMVGSDIAVKVVEIDRARNRLILSERAAAREWREQQKSRLLGELAVGETRRGKVISLADFGAFVDLGGADGLVHLTELSWQHITHPREILHVGQEVEVEVINIDPNRKRIGLSMKRRENDPWRRVVEGYDVGQLVQATVTKLTKFGAFARLLDAQEIEGLIHISELADYRVSHPREVVLVGDVLTLRIVKIEADQRRLGLSLRQVDSMKYLDQDWQAIAGDMADDGPEPPTIGEMVQYEAGDEADADPDNAEYAADDEYEDDDSYSDDADDEFEDDNVDADDADESDD